MLPQWQLHKQVRLIGSEIEITSAPVAANTKVLAS